MSQATGKQQPTDGVAWALFGQQDTTNEQGEARRRIGNDEHPARLRHSVRYWDARYCDQGQSRGRPNDSDPEGPQASQVAGR
jgi:hypothetical protein